MKKQYNNYTNDDHERWSFLMKRKKQLLSNANTSFLDGFELIGLREDRVPSFDELNEVLQPLTGWRYEAADGDQPINSFFEALSRRVFLSSTQVRSWEELDFCKLPDIFHDVFGHAGLLTLPSFADFLENLGKLGVQYKHHEPSVKYLSAIYWYTAEVGLINEDDTLKYYGGSIISSASEIETVYDQGSKKKTYTATEAGTTSYDSYVVNNTYYTIDSMETLNSSLAEITNYLEQNTQPVNGRKAGIEVYL